jgi:hypothetical protein|tara:strand:- start:374 stop:1003 length:630 start_codon:yes stop_codon:yes gene_type:complete
MKQKTGMCLSALYIAATVAFIGVRRLNNKLKTSPPPESYIAATGEDRFHSQDRFYKRMTFTPIGTNAEAFSYKVYFNGSLENAIVGQIDNTAITNKEEYLNVWVAPKIDPDSKELYQNLPRGIGEKIYHHPSLPHSKEERDIIFKEAIKSIEEKVKEGVDMDRIHTEYDLRMQKVLTNAPISIYLKAEGTFDAPNPTVNSANLKTIWVQ